MGKVGDDGSGYGGYGDGDGGYGYGYGDGGYGYGYGDGGYGYGGYGDGGYGDGGYGGYGYGYGYGGGGGYGDGGYGYGDGGYAQALLPESEEGSRVLNSGGVIAFWRSHTDGASANTPRGPDKVERSVGMVEEVKGPLKLCTEHALHATHKPWEWNGDRLWIVGLYPPFKSTEDKIGSLRRVLLAEIPNFCLGLK